MAAVRCVLFDQTFVGPVASLDDTLASLRHAGFQVRPLEVGLYGPDGNAWLIAEMAMPSTPSHDDQTALMDRAAEASQRYGFERRQHAVAWGWRQQDGGV